MRVAIREVPPVPREEAPALPALVDNPFAPEIFVTGVSGFSNLGSVIVVTVDNARCDHSRQPPTLERQVVARLALSVGAAQQLVANLNSFLEAQGMSPSEAIAKGATRQ